MPVNTMCPKLKEVKVPLQQLLLDPNNPRFVVESESPVDLAHVGYSGIQGDTAVKMQQDRFQIRQLAESIKRNGWQPVDRIFVRRVAEDSFLVLEGNRRVTALRALAAEESLVGELKTAVDPLSVLEVEGSEEEVKAQVTYLLGVRHHGSLVEWKPFAQAHNIYERYKRAAGQTDDSFEWNDGAGESVAGTLSLPVKTVRERVRTYRVMKQLEAFPPIRDGARMQGRYYSVVAEVLDRPANSPLREYVLLDASTFRLDDASVVRIENVCHFSQPGRRGAPIAKPQEWRSFERILRDADVEKRDAMRRRVEEDKILPSNVYAERAAELRQPRWDTWLKEVEDVLRGVKLGEVELDTQTTEVARRLAEVLDGLAAMGNPEVRP